MLGWLLREQDLPVLHRLACPRRAVQLWPGLCEDGKLEMLAHWLLDLVTLASGLSSWVSVSDGVAKP